MMKMMSYTLMMKSMDGSKLDFNKYKDRFREIYPSLSEEEREEIFHLRVDFLRMIVDNYETFNTS